MIAAEFEIGANLLALGMASITLLTLIVNTVKTNRAVTASESAAAQLQNNGGLTALDKLQRGQRDISAQLEAVAERLDEHDRQLARILEQPAESHSDETDRAGGP